MTKVRCIRIPDPVSCRPRRRSQIGDARRVSRQNTLQKRGRGLGLKPLNARGIFLFLLLVKCKSPCSPSIAETKRTRADKARVQAGGKRGGGKGGRGGHVRMRGRHHRRTTLLAMVCILKTTRPEKEGSNTARHRRFRCRKKTCKVWNNAAASRQRAAATAIGLGA